MLQFRSKFTSLERIFLPRAIVWSFLFIVLSLGYFIDGLDIVKVDKIVILVSLFIVVLSCVPIFFIKQSVKSNFYYLLTVGVIDLLSVSLLFMYSDQYQHIFLFMYVLCLISAGVVMNKVGLAAFTLLASILFYISTSLAVFELKSAFQASVVLMFIVVSYSIVNLKTYFKNLIRHLRIKDHNISILEFFNIYLINNLQNGLIVVDENFDISFWSAASEKILSASNSSVIGKNLKYLFPFFCDHCGKETSEHIESWETINEVRKCLSYKVSPIFVEGDFVGNIIVFEDITKFKETQRLNEQNRHLAGIGRLAATLAHEIRNPLASISGSVEMLKVMPADSEDSKKLMTIVVREIDSLNVLINELLDYVKPIKLEKTKVNMKSLIMETIDLLRYETNIPIIERLDETIEFECDPKKLKQVFINVLKNAIEVLATDGGNVEVSLSKLNDEKIVMKFKDNGPGITEENIDSIFEPFFTTKDSGTGLGLATSRNIVVMHSGDMTVRSEPGNTEFKIVL